MPLLVVPQLLPERLPYRLHNFLLHRIAVQVGLLQQLIRPHSGIDRRGSRVAPAAPPQLHASEEIGQAQDHEIVVFKGVERVRVADTEKQAAFELELPRVTEPTRRLDEQRRRAVLDIDDRAQ